MGGLRARRGGFEFRFGRGRRNRRAGCSRSSTGRRVVDDVSGLDLRTAPRAVIDNQHCQHAENRNYRRDRGRAARRPFRVILVHLTCLTLTIALGNQLADDDEGSCQGQRFRDAFSWPTSICRARPPGLRTFISGGQRLHASFDASLHRARRPKGRPCASCGGVRLALEDRGDRHRSASSTSRSRPSQSVR